MVSARFFIPSRSLIHGRILQHRQVGSQGLEVSAQGLGCMGMSAAYGPPKPESDMIALVHHAIDSGVTFLDTSDIYGPHTNEILLGKVWIPAVDRLLLDSLILRL